MQTITLKHSEQQTGAVLIVSLLMLLVTTMLGITAMSTAVMEEKMAGNNFQKQLAIQGSESGLRFAEAWLTTNLTNISNFATMFASGTPTSEIYTQRKPDNATAVNAIPATFNQYNLNAWTAGNSISTSQPLASGQPNPKYIIEYMGKDGEPPINNEDPDTRKHLFRITSIGIGTDTVTTHVSQSTFRMPLF